MFTTSIDYASQVQKVINSSNALSIAVAFWGSTSEQIFLNSQGKPIKIICNLTMGGTNPDPIKKLRANKNIEIRQFNELHAKVIAGENIALVGSANFSTNGLNFEFDEGIGWEEAGLITKDTTEIKKIQAWFDKLWNKSSPITDYDIQTAERIWGSRRKHRQQKGHGGSLLACPLPDLRDQPIYLAIWRRNCSDSAAEEFNSLKESESQLMASISDKLDFFEGWDDLPLDASLISVYYGPRGGIEVEYSWQRIPILDSVFIDKESNEKTSIQIVAKEKLVRDMVFGPKEMKDLQTRLKPLIEELWNNRPGEDETVIVPLYDFLLKDLEFRAV